MTGVKVTFCTLSFPPLMIWECQDREDIYTILNLLPNQKYNVDYVLRRFEEFCEPVCNFRMAHFKLAKVHQNTGEPVYVFYNRILKIGHKYEFSDLGERMIDAIIFHINFIKTWDKLLQTPKTLNLQQCLTVCCH